MKSLQQLRESWEKDLRVLTEINLTDIQNKLLIVLQKDEEGKYYCYRYFCLADYPNYETFSWHISIDKAGCELKEVWEWIHKESNE